MNSSRGTERRIIIAIGYVVGNRLQPRSTLPLFDSDQNNQVRPLVIFQGPSIWNSIDEDIKSSSLSLFKKKVKPPLIEDY